MTKLVYISSIAAPHQIKLCGALNKYLDAEFWFYEHLNEGRPGWWKIALGPKCKILGNLLVRKNSKYFTFDVVRCLKKNNPDVVMLGGFTIPSNCLAYLWAKLHGKKTIVFTELSRDPSGRLRKFGISWRLIKFFYRNVDYIFTANSDATRQFKHDFGFGDRVVTTRYASDLDSHMLHPWRTEKESYTYLFANRLTKLYNPLLAIDIFSEIQKKHPQSILLINDQGALKDECISKIEGYGLGGNVEFLSDIKNWNDLHKVYLRADVLIFPALFSNGNFSINEAMASGMGIVISDKINGHSNTLLHGKNCFIVPPDIESFVAATEQYIQYPPLLLEHAKINRKLMMPLSVEGTAEFIHKTLQSLDLVEDCRE